MSDRIPGTRYVWEITAYPTAADIASINAEDQIDNRASTANDNAELLEDEDEDDLEEADDSTYWTDSDGINRDGGEPW